MNRDQIDTALDAAEEALGAAGRATLGPTGFWKAVAAVKRDPSLIAPYADRIAAIDRAAFERWAVLTVPIRIGTWLAVGATLAGLAVITAGYYVAAPWNGLLLIAGTAILLVSTHGLAHLFAGRRAGIRFTHWFIGTLRRPQPGVKVDYATYLRAAPMRRAWMHAAGAIVTKVLPFLLLGAAWGMEAPVWAWIGLLLIGAVAVTTDVVWSTKSSDWKKYSRERSYA